MGVTFVEGEQELVDAGFVEGTLGDEDGNHLKGSLAAVEADADYEAGISDGNLVAAAGVGGTAAVLQASGAYQNSHGTSMTGKAYLVGAEGNVDAGLSLGKDGFNANAGGEVFVGGKAEGEIHQDFGPVDASVGGEISYGIGAHAEVDAEISADHVGVDFDIGATFGLGGGIKVDIGFDPTPWN